MANSLLVLGGPMILFVILDSIQGLKAALIGAVIACLFELGYSYYIIGEIDNLTLISIGLILTLALTSFIKKDSLYFKLQPAILALIISLFFLGCWWLDRNILYELMVKYQELVPAQNRELLIGSFGQQLLSQISFYSIFTFAIHAGAMFFIAKKCSNLIWVISRGAGTLLSVGAAFILTKLL